MAADLPPTPPAAAPAAVTAPAPAAAEPIYVDAGGYRYSVVGNKLLPRAAVEAAIKGAPGPKEAADALGKAYQDAGYLLVVIGGQVNNKLVALTVIQGRIAELDVPPDLAPYFRGVLDRDDLTRNTLLRTSALADLYASRQGVRPKASYSPAQAMGGTRLTVVEEPIEGAKPWSAGLGFSNLSGRFSSRYTWNGSVAVRPGGGLELTANYTQGIPGLTPESSGASYRGGSLASSILTPWGSYAITYGNTEYQIGEVQAPLYPYGQSEFAGVTGTQLVYADPSNRVTTTQGLNRYSNKQFVFGGFPIVDQDYTVANLGATYTTTFALAGRNSSFSATATVAKGLSAPTGTFLPRNPGTADPRFFLVQGSAALSIGLPHGFTAGATITAQQADVTVPQAQQWILGGLGNLSAWLPATLIGDSGALGRATVSSPPLAWGGFSMTGTVFAEAGVARADSRKEGESYSAGLGDVGLALSGSTTKGTNLTLVYAWPVWYRNVDGPIRELADRSRANLYFTLNQSF